MLYKRLPVCLCFQRFVQKYVTSTNTDRNIVFHNALTGFTFILFDEHLEDVNKKR